MSLQNKHIITYKFIIYPCKIQYIYIYIYIYIYENEKRLGLQILVQKQSDEVAFYFKGVCVSISNPTNKHGLAIRLEDLHPLFVYI